MERFILPQITKSQNPYERSHWASRRQDRDAWYNVVRACCGLGKLDKSGQPSKRQVKLIRVSRRLIDDQNVPADTKALVDALEHYGHIYDDSRKWTRVTWDQRKCGPGEEPHMEIEIKSWAGD